MSGREEYLEEVRDQIRVAKARSSDSANTVDMSRTNLLSEATARLVRKRFENKRRVYVNDPSEAPDDANIQEGPRGGMYFETGAGQSREAGSTDDTSSNFDIEMDDQVDQLDDQDARDALAATVVMHQIARDTDLENEDPAKMDQIEGLVSSGQILPAYEQAYGNASVNTRDMRNMMRENQDKSGLELIAERYLTDDVGRIRDSLKEVTRQLGIRDATVARDMIRDSLEEDDSYNSDSDYDPLAEVTSQTHQDYLDLYTNSYRRSKKTRNRQVDNMDDIDKSRLRERMRMARKYASRKKLVSNTTAKLVRKRFENKRRVYITDPSEAPDNVDVEEGPRGGMYYETGGGGEQSTFGIGEKPPGYLGGPGNPIPDTVSDIEADLPTDDFVNYGDADAAVYGGHYVQYDENGGYFETIETHPVVELFRDDEIEENPNLDRDSHFITEAYIDMDDIFENPDDLSAGLTEEAERYATNFSRGSEDPLAFAVENPALIASELSRHYGGDTSVDSGNYDRIMSRLGVDTSVSG